MKTIKGVLCAVLAAMAGTVLAEDEASTPGPSRQGWYVAPMATYMLADSKRCGVDDSTGGSIALGNRDDFATVELWGQYLSLPYDCATVNKSGDVKLNGGGLTLLVGPFFEQRILARFFGIVGFGIIRRQDHPRFTQDDNTIFGDAGLGYMHPLQLFAYDLNFRTEARYRYDVQQPLHSSGVPLTFSDVVFNIGLQIPLSREPDPVPEPPPPPVAVVAIADEDGDGVPDESDKCPGSATGAAVDGTGCVPEPVAGPVTLDTAKAGDTIVLSGVNFEFDRAVLQSNARIILDGVAKQLLARPELKIEVGGHTDGRGNEFYNQHLSERRAESVQRYLIEQGVGAERLTAVGYGEAQPVDGNDTDEGRERNRRVELKILE